MKKENGSVTLFVLIAMLLIVAVLTIIYMQVREKNNNQAHQIEKIQEEYQSGNSSLDSIYNNALSKNETEEDDDTIKPYGKGDVNFDGVVDNLDLDLVLQHVNERIVLQGEQFERADLNNDGVVDSGDLSSLLSYINSRT